MVQLREGETLSAAMRRGIEERVEKLGGLVEAIQHSTVKIREAESQHVVYEMTKRIVSANAPTWIVKRSLMPEEIQKMILENSRHYSDLRITAAYPAHGGQSGGGGENVSLIILPWWSERDSRMIEIEVGCSHDMVTTNLGRCYNKYSCTKCEYAYTVDSGD